MDKKKVLIIAYYWPPAGGPGVQRWLKFVKYLPEFGVDPIVYVPENPNYPIVDESLCAEVPEDLTILKQPIREPYKFASVLSKKSSASISKGIIPKQGKQSLVQKLLIYIRGNFFIPDARKAWVKPSVNYLSKYILENKIETIITTGPPHSLHIIGLKLKETMGVNWLADFRDPWTTIGYHKKLKLTKASQAKHEKLESKVLNTADTVLVTSYTTKKEFESITNKPIEVITNGYDYEKVGAVSLDSKFTLSHIGSLLSERNPKVLWRIINELMLEVDGFRDDFQLNLIGAVSENVLESIKKSNLTNYINNIGYVSHLESVRFQKKSQLLLLIEIDSEETKCIIPGKLFEYMVSNRPILAIGPKQSDIEKIIKETNTGNYFCYEDYDALKETLISHYTSFKNNTLESHAVGLQKYSRKNLTKHLAEVLLN
ncbi:glycosyltransferase family 4 protein [Flavobacteriaceae bacterium XHP0103]|uniref:glycosyltransferase family 4 protein n=1 Tax=Marixanthotalea marina TaxID=2844359 RepID=UPI002989B73B|nr:glycosyltransferase family 4 protein [Marixanthotalea marina]MBU3822325.1 glycosyltransferase family 4 protein [Marixanthotalea marina]